MCVYIYIYSIIIVCIGNLPNGKPMYGSENWDNKFWSSVVRDEGGVFQIGSGLNISETWHHENLEDHPSNYLAENLNRTCSVFQAKQNEPSKFWLRARDCEDEKLVICRAKLVLENIENDEFPCLQYDDISDVPRTNNSFNSTEGNATTGNDVNVLNSTLSCDEESMEDDTSPIGIQKLNMIFNPCLTSEKERIRNKSKEEYQRTIGSMDMKKSFESLFQLLWYSQLPCFDVENITSKVKDEMSLIKRCYWKGRSISCASIFVTRPTDRGMCCTFNMEKAEELFREGKYGDMVSSMQTQDSLGSFENISLPSWYLEQNEPTTQPGQNKGLMLVLDAHTDKVSSGSVSDNFKGFITVVDDTDNYPLTERNGFLVRPGRENHVAMSALEILGADAIRSITPEDRDCYFSDEHPLEMHQRYSQSNCVLECNIKYARKAMMEQNETVKCTPWFYPIADADISQFCDPWDTLEFQNLMASAPDEECSSCLPDCTKTIYEATVSAAPFRQCDHTNLGTSQLCDLEDKDMNPPIWSQLVQNEYISANGEVPEFATPTETRMSNTRKYVASQEKEAFLVLQVKNNQTPEYDAYTNDIARVNFYFDKSTVLLYKRDQRMTEIDFISQMGGLLGLGIGCSFISIIELLYWMTIRLGRNSAGVKGK